MAGLHPTISTAIKAQNEICVNPQLFKGSGATPPLAPSSSCSYFPPEAVYHELDKLMQFYLA
jgi:hypothetical protein